MFQRNVAGESFFLMEYDVVSGIYFGLWTIKIVLFVKSSGLNTNQYVTRIIYQTRALFQVSSSMSFWNRVLTSTQVSCHVHSESSYPNCVAIVTILHSILQSLSSLGQVEEHWSSLRLRRL